MDWSLLAGGLSKGLESALGGANQGLVQGEEIRRSQSQEDLQRQGMGLQQEQFKNTLAQQDFMNRMAQERFGLAKRSAETQAAKNEWEMSHGDALRRLQEREAAVKEGLLPAQIKEKEAHAKYWETGGAGALGGRGTERERLLNARAMKAGFRSYLEAPPDLVAQWAQEHESLLPNYGFRQAHDQRMNNIYSLRSRLIEQALRYPPLSGKDRARHELARQQAITYNQAMNRVLQANTMGIAPSPKDIELIESTDFSKIVGALTDVANQVEGRGFGAANPGIDPSQIPSAQPPTPGGVQGLMQKWKLQ